METTKEKTTKKKQLLHAIAKSLDKQLHVHAIANRRRGSRRKKDGRKLHTIAAGEVEV